MNPEKGENAGGVGLGTGLFALLFWVIEESKAGPGTSK